jgi:class 3 adenylate cyclase/tetratricopeptide (TPR) repeat protein
VTVSRTCTILFTDLVASTELRTSVGDDAFDERRREHDHLLDESVVRFGGEVVKHAGDGVMATFGAAADAVACAVAMQQGLARLNARRAFPLQMRVGMSAGDVVFEDGDCHGTPVVEAARLCGAARAARILAADLVRALAGSRGGHQFVPADPVALKGLPDSLTVCEVAWSLPDTERTDVPPRLRELADRGRCVGREVEVDAVVNAWKLATTADTRQLVLVAGEPGIGKTRLASEVAARIADHGGAVLHGWCDEDLGSPYQPWVQVLGALARTMPSEDLAELGDAVAPELARLVPDLATSVAALPGPSSGDADTDRARTVDAVDAFLSAVCAHQPLLVVLDDLHWSDRPSLVLLRRLLQSERGGALLILGTYRDTDVDRRHPLSEVLADLRREPRVTRLALDGLDVAGLAALLADRAGHDAPVDFVRLLRDDTNGNPFFVEEVIAHFVETGVIYQRDGTWITDLTPEQIGIPEGVRDVVGRRLSRLSPEANEALSVAAFIGREFDASTLVAASGRERDDVLDALDAALATGLVREVPGAMNRYAFSHALVRQTLAEEVRGARRARLHWRVGEALASARAPELSAVAFHLCEGVLAGDGRRATEAALAAAEHALSVAAPEEAQDLARRALEVLDDERVEAPLLRCHALVLEGETAAANVTDVHSARDALAQAGRLAREHGATDLLVRAAFAFGSLFTPGETLPEATRLASAALDVVAPDDARRALLLAVRGQFRYHDGEFAEGARDIEECVAIAEASGDRVMRRVAYQARSYLLVGMPDVEAFARAVQQAEAADDEMAREHWVPRGFRGALLVRRGDRAGLESLTAEVRAQIERNYTVAGDLLCQVWRGALAAADGRLDDIGSIAQHLSRAAPPGSVFDAFATALAMVKTVAAGDIDALVEGVGSLFRRDQPGLDRNLHGFEAFALAQRGDSEAARAAVRRALPAGAASLTPDYNRPGILVYAGVAAAEIGMTDLLAELGPEVEAYRGQLLVGPWGFRAYDAADSLRAQMLTALGRYDEAVDAAREGLALAERFGPYLAAQCRLRLAAALLGRGTSVDRDEARHAVDDVVEFCERRGIVAERQAAERLIAGSG